MVSRIDFYRLAYTVIRVKGFYANLGKIEGRLCLGFAIASDYGQRSTQRNGQRKHLKIKGFRAVIVQGMDNYITNTFPTNKKVKDIYLFINGCIFNLV